MSSGLADTCLGTAQTETHDSAINGYKWAVIASHAVVFTHFLYTHSLAVLTNDIEPLCWPYFQNCWRVRFDTTTPTTVLFCVQAGLIILGTVFLAARCHRAFWIVVVVLNIYLFSIVSLDYRLRGNQVYMLFWLNLVFLLWPTKRWAIPLVLISFYFWAGTLKLNYEWLSGAVLYHRLYIIPPRFAWVACIYVVVLELVLVWGLLAKRAWVRWLTLGELALFHAESVSQVGWFYPLLMATLLSWFVIDWTVRDTLTASLAKFWRGRAPRPAYVLVAIFAGCQLVPYLYHGDKVLTGQGRIFALDMLEAQQVCDVRAVVHFRDHTADVVDLLMIELPPRKICDPIVYYDRVTNLCRSHSSDPNFTDVDFVMRGRRTTEAKLTTIIDEANFCGRRETYKIFSNNNWMK